MKKVKSNFSSCLGGPGLIGLDWRTLVIVGAASLAMNVLLFAMPVFSLQVYDRVLSSRSQDTLLFLIGFVVFALCMYAVLDVLRGKLLLRIGDSYVINLGVFVFDA